MAIKVDMEKAYDLSDRDYIRKCFIDFGFSDRWIDWIMQYITTITFKVLMNGKTSNPIYPERGIR